MIDLTLAAFNLGSFNIDDDDGKFITSFSHNDKFVFLLLCDHADSGARCWPSIAHLAKRSLLSERSVVRSIKVLTQAHLIRIEPPNTRRRSNTYVIQVDELANLFFMFQQYEQAEKLRRIHEKLTGDSPALAA